ncbi:MAG: DUF58 domain-containing protein [Treponema sp.]|jgi:uncharacterized protein (DUF58 family)|nr:DUF58 domain-containing protein [Treponema sp.]
MDRYELLKRIATFPLLAPSLAEGLLAGDLRSVFKGQGIEADEVRHYELGDDIRSIDWNVSARFGTPYVKLYREEREMMVSLVLDCSASMHTGGGPLSRYDQAVLTTALMAFSAEQAGQRVGTVFFNQGITQVFPPRKGRSHIMAMISGALSAPVGGRSSDLGAALTGVGRLLKRRSLVVIISDFFCVHWEQELGDLRRKHDVLAIRISDPLDEHLSGLGLITMEDPETGRRYHVPAGFASFRAAWSAWHEDRLAVWKSLCRRAGVACLELSTTDDAPASLIRFFGGWGERRGSR